MALYKKYVGRLVLVEWHDACSGNGWDHRGHEETTDRIVSFGIFKRESDKEIELIPNRGSTHKLHQIGIPKGAIKRIRRLRI